MRQQWFTHVRLLIAHPPRYSETSTAALTTPALDRRSLRWFGVSACTATPEDLPPSLAQHGSCRRSSTSSSSLPFRTHVGAENSAVVVDLPRCGPMLSSRVPNLVPIPGITGSAHCAVRPLEGSDSRAVRGSVGQGSPRSVFRKADPESLDRHAGLCVPGPRSRSRSRSRLRRYAGRHRRRLHATHGTQDRERRTCSARHDRVSATHRLPRCSALSLTGFHAGSLLGRTRRRNVPTTRRMAWVGFEDHGDLWAIRHWRSVQVPVVACLGGALRPTGLL